MSHLRPQSGQNNGYDDVLEEDHRGHASYAAIVEYSKMQEQLLMNLKQRLHIIRSGEYKDVESDPTPSHRTREIPRGTLESLMAFENAAVAAKKLPSKNKRNIENKSKTNSRYNPKRDYPRPWALDQENNISYCKNEGSVLHQQFKSVTIPNPQKQYYPSVIEHQSIMNPYTSMNMESPYIVRPMCHHCHYPVMDARVGQINLASQMHSPPATLRQVPQHFLQQPIIDNSQRPQKLVAAGSQAQRPKEEQFSWDINCFTSNSLDTYTNSDISHFNTVVFPEPQAKRHPYLMKFLQKSTSRQGSKESNIRLSSSNKQQAGAEKVTSKGIRNTTKTKGSSRGVSLQSQNTIPKNSTKSVTTNLKTEKNFQSEWKSQARRIGSIVSAEQSNDPLEQLQRENVTLLPPRCILSSLSPWSMLSTEEPRGQQQEFDWTTDEDSEEDKHNHFKQSNYIKEAAQRKSSLDAAAMLRAQTYQVFPDPDKNRTLGAVLTDLEEVSLTKQEKKRHSSEEGSYGSMKVTRDPKEDLIKRIYEDFESFEELNGEKKSVEECVLKDVGECKSGGDRKRGKPPAINKRPTALIVKVKDSRSLVRNQKVRHRKASATNCSLQSTASSPLRVPILKRSVSLMSFKGTKGGRGSVFNVSMQNYNFPPLVVDKEFPEVEKVLEEARRLSPYVDNLDKLLEAPPSVDHLSISKLPWMNSKTAKFPSWFREVDPISKLGDHLTINEVFHIDIKPGQFRSHPLETFITNSVGVFLDSQSSITGNISNCTNLASSVVLGGVTNKLVDEALRKQNAVTSNKSKSVQTVVIEDQTLRISSAEATTVGSTKVDISPSKENPATKLDRLCTTFQGAMKSDIVPEFQKLPITKSAGTVTKRTEAVGGAGKSIIPVLQRDTVIDYNGNRILREKPQIVVCQAELNNNSIGGISPLTRAKTLLAKAKNDSVSQTLKVMADELNIKLDLPQVDRKKLKRPLDSQDSYSNIDDDTSTVIIEDRTMTKIDGPEKWFIPKPAAKSQVTKQKSPLTTSKNIPGSNLPICKPHKTSPAAKFTSPVTMKRSNKK